jgi:2-polyprenyl-3-methyl-5-hydroxy-6-metoxy-1,4-benzoquinol methylase
MNIISPVTKKSNVKLISKISSEIIIKKYLEAFKIDVSYLFKGIEEVFLLLCKDSGYKFFYPCNISGDGKFYEQLQEFDWYYMPWKWEHEQAFKLIKPKDQLLEVGCGSAGFLKEVNNRIKNISLTGLELNKSAIESGRKYGINILSELIQEHAQSYYEKYDIVCSFQVLEHISDIHSFMEAQIKALKKGGKLIVSVPNNDGFLSDSENTLNMPPHHMGLWGESSLRKMGEYFGLKHLSTHFEPLQEYHRSYYQFVRNVKLTKLNKLVGLLSRFNFIDNMVFPKKYRAFTIQMVWMK